jgi:hypothetical protein
MATEAPTEPSVTPTPVECTHSTTQRNSSGPPAPTHSLTGTGVVECTHSTTLRRRRGNPPPLSAPTAPLNEPAGSGAINGIHPRHTRHSVRICERVAVAHTWHRNAPPPWHTHGDGRWPAPFPPTRCANGVRDPHAAVRFGRHLRGHRRSAARRSLAHYTPRT